ncbi:hypothetical protein Halru_3153 [Halovivax ruber XH-70]|uniref:Uncharacterized protein n=1 Tax=Halovivax ruber (strain DSM 18193 / JCM 13892 / XH-70) TaxID=797302 RepID=L0IG31_HALRX|nr:hypothetical protein [Halovivax ruber]AGB17719.1 hypothetical protein Halru_3153 [Halovivax ruber XH-70]
MEAQVIDRDDQDIGVEVDDNNGVEHRILVSYDGDISGHSQDGYPDDPERRSTSEQETIFHARRYAKYYVAQETEYDTIPWDLNPGRFETVRDALAALTADELDDYFGDLFAQSLSHYADDPDVDTGGTERPYELPTDKIGPDGAVLYEQEIYLDESDDIEAVSGVIVEYYVAKGERTTVRHDEAPVPDRDSDARIEISPAPFVDLKPFRDYLVYNLRCQIRDCYVGMGLEPPAAYKVLGPGQYRFTGKYQHFECYPAYFDVNADIPGYSHEFAPELPISDAELGGLVDLGSERSLYSQLKGALFSR